MSFSADHKDTSGTSTSTLDPRTADVLFGNVAQAQSLAATPYQPYSGSLVAGFTPTQQQAQDALASMAGNQVGAAPLQSAINTAQGVAGYHPQMVSAQTISAQPLTGVDLSGYMNPYTSQVIDTTMAGLARQSQIQDANDAARATAARAFGGSRSAVLQNLDRESASRTAASTLAGLNQSNFTQAQNAAQADLARGLSASQSNQSAALQAALGNQNAGLQAQGMNLNAANALAGYGNDQLNQALQRAGALSTAGNAQQQNQQDQLNAAYQQWQLAQAYPLQMQQLMNQTVGTLPTNYGTTKSSGSETGEKFGVGASTGANGPLSFLKIIPL
jgi:hypothetical protein